MSTKLLLIGWDAADWNVIHPLMDTGQMPHLERLVNQGVIGNIATLYPILSPMLWTSIATGKRAHKHGIYGFIEPDSRSGGVRPITNLSRKTKAIWNILNQCGKKVNVVGWWPSHPAEPLDGVMISNHFHRAPSDPRKPWRMPPGTVHPSSHANHLASLRVPPWELEGDMLLPFVPRAREIDQESDTRLFNLAKVIAECSSVHAAATAVMQLEPWDFMAVYYDAIDHFSHGFMKYHPPRLEWVKENDFELYRDVIQGAYRFHDLMLGTLLSLAGDETTVLLLSDHGFHSDHLRPKVLPNEPVGPAAEHRPLGIFVLSGPGLKRDERIYGASLLDVCPTILHLFGLPVGRDMDGRVLGNAFQEPTEALYIDSWDDVDGPSGQHPPDLRLDAVEAQEAIQQLVELGYIDQPAEDNVVAADEATRELNYHLAQSHIDAQQHRVAAGILRDLWARWPEELRFGVALLQCQVALELTTEARATVDAVRAAKSLGATRAAEEVQRFKEQYPDGPPKDLDPRERARIRRLYARAQVNRAPLNYLEACVLQMEKRYDEAIPLLRRALASEPGRRVAVFLKLGEIQLQLRRGPAAETSFRRVLDLDPHNPHAYVGLCRLFLKRGNYAKAAEIARQSLGRLFHNPQAHYLHGIALRQCGEVDLAVRAFETALQQNPNFPTAHARLAAIWSNDRNDPQRAEFHRLQAEELRRFNRKQRRTRFQNDAPLATQPDTKETSKETKHAPLHIRRPELNDVPPSEWIVVVSGLPRSGTSMMMQMLQAGGVPIRTDAKRAADESNPRGYLELEEVKGLAKDSQWVAEARGSAIKVVAQLVPYLPPKLHYKFIFMDRDLDEVLQSQTKMLHRVSDPQSVSVRDSARLRETYQKQIGQALTMIQRRPHAELVTIAYRDAIERAPDVARKVAEFLGFPRLKVAEMATTVDRDLYRSKTT